MYAIRLNNFVLNLLELFTRPVYEIFVSHGNFSIPLSYLMLPMTGSIKMYVSCSVSINQ